MQTAKLTEYYAFIWILCILYAFSGIYTKETSKRMANTSVVLPTT